MKHTASLALLLFVSWLLWSGMSFPWGEHFELLLLLAGVGSTALVVFLAARMDLADHEGAPVDLANLRVVAYIPWLLWQIVLANLDVTRRILDPRLPISPTLIDVPASQGSELGQVIYANSITLTPGTVSVDVEGGVITVHALSRSAADGVETGDMDRRVTRLEGAA